MIRCPTCQALHPHNTLYCLQCGKFLVESAEQVAADSFKAAHPIRDNLDVVSGLGQRGLDPETLVLFVGSERRRIVVSLAKDIVLGRPDPAAGFYPDVDLSADGALEKGVSRRHVRLSRRGDKIRAEDLGSVNGTFHNGRRLKPYEPQMLKTGDELQLGKLLIYVEI